AWASVLSPEQTSSAAVERMRRSHDQHVRLAGRIGARLAVRIRRPPGGSDLSSLQGSLASATSVYRTRDEFMLVKLRSISDVHLAAVEAEGSMTLRRRSSCAEISHGNPRTRGRPPERSGTIPGWSLRARVCQLCLRERPLLHHKRKGGEQIRMRSLLLV